MTAPAAAWVAIVRRELRRRLIEEQLPRICRCARMLGDERVWDRPTPNTNSVGNLIRHLCGNTTQWILAQFTDLDDARARSGSPGRWPLRGAETRPGCWTWNSIATGSKAMPVAATCRTG